VLLGKSPFLLLGGLTALTAVLLIVFKDTILNLVAGIQIQAYDMVRVGDWIVMPKYGADGDVSEIALNTVTVQNFDKTISTIPTRAVIDEYLKNWRGMKDSGGRRIKRSIAIDVNSIKFCTPVMITRLSRIQLLQAYIERKQKELTEHNAANGIDDESLANGRRMTNVGTFRAYLTEYLRGHPSIDTNKTFLVRQLQPTEGGLPIQIYVFANDTVWANYEAIQADIFDHVLAVLPEFELRICQNLTGHDLNELAQTLVSKWKGALS
jgi:miniconductance mechanosensitive channel